MTECHAKRQKTVVCVTLTEEKGSDVNLGVHLVNDAHLDRFDVALVVSQDSDLLEPMRIVKAMGKQVDIIWLQPRPKAKSAGWRGPSKYFESASSFVKYARKPSD
ncbi:MAG: NYN domain-containing protein [Henriciella sp.]